MFGRNRLVRMMRSRRFLADETGNVLITVGVALPVIVAVAGAALSYSMGNANKSKLQGAMDAAVLTGAAAGGSATDQQAAAQQLFNQNISGFVASTTEGTIGSTFTSDGVIVSGQATANMKNLFGGVVGSRTIAVSVSAAAKKVQIPICVLGLNNLDHGSFDVNGQPQFNASCGVQANTTSTSGMSQEGNAYVQATKFAVSGGHKTTNYSPTPTDGAAKVPDPYASLPFPFADDCSSGTAKQGGDIKDDTTLSPGTYCGGLHISSTAHVTLQPGIYVMSGGPFWTDGGAAVTGDQVMIAFTGKGSTLEVWGNSSVNLTSPTSGTYKNMQFFQDASSDTKGLWVSVGGGSSSTAKLQFDGTAYFPTQNFWAYGNSVTNANSPGVAVVADKIWAQGNATFNVTAQDRRNLGISGPTLSSGVVLIR
jgi:Flp pilus assembly protein TadG